MFGARIFSLSSRANRTTAVFRYHPAGSIPFRKFSNLPAIEEFVNAKKVKDAKQISETDQQEIRAICKELVSNLQTPKLKETLNDLAIFMEESDKAFPELLEKFKSAAKTPDWIQLTKLLPNTKNLVSSFQATWESLEHEGVTQAPTKPFPPYEKVEKRLEELNRREVSKFLLPFFTHELIFFFFLNRKK